MSDALLSPAVGGTMWAVTAGVAAYSARKIDRLGEASRIPLMGVLGAFVFAAMMVNFSIPGTGSSGHLGGGLLLAILLGPYAAFIVMASVLVVQALFFADGGLLALGCNVFNLAFFTSFLVYPLIWKPLAGRKPSGARLFAASIIAAIVGLQLGAFGVVLETEVSGISSLPFGTFALLMQPIHLAIGMVEGLVTASVVLIVWRARPELLAAEMRQRNLRPILIGLGVTALVTASVMSWFASVRPDGLEWSVARATGSELPTPADAVHSWLAKVQRTTAFLPDYDFRPATAQGRKSDAAPAWPAPSPGTSTSGVLGSLLVLGLAAATGYGIRVARHRRAQED
ncbi:MAG TPA: energy-coupling factor ABC transporter permease [Anaeromyxobacter sp.]|nr:energy-coupling factor ABC transporter permease [Anaeromyxobacter sp.]